LILLLQSFNFAVCLLSLAQSHFLGILPILQVFEVIVVFDDLVLNVLLDMPVLGFVLLVEETQLSQSLLQINQLLLSFFDTQLDICQIFSGLVDCCVQVVILVLIALNLLTQNLLLNYQLLVITVEFSEALTNAVIVLL
jgi:hypothetical protein